MKYIRVIAPTGIEIPVLFGDLITHVDISEALRKIGYQTISAGFVRLGKIDPVCCGESTSLDMRPLHTDATLIKVTHQSSNAHQEMFSATEESLSAPTSNPGHPEPAPMQYPLPSA